MAGPPMPRRVASSWSPRASPMRATATPRPRRGPPAAGSDA